MSGELAGAGLLKRRSVPALVLGKAITSRIDSALQRIAMSRSKPIVITVSSAMREQL
ncbi:hypothetical protein PHLCEN_2v10593 [Hermanssonia centrifuga]|uniref:Uncharacterized protein n=1 Tax=Hermanssonia centrifuga TaxID=98765 RepID=A0A2R6NMQ9_9APHY|nr:hypothetical protein PHLCEN_2v10593 [Hermanssonia centrifuga]